MHIKRLHFKLYYLHYSGQLSIRVSFMNSSRYIGKELRLVQIK